MLELSTPGNVIAGWELYLLIHVILHIRYETSHIAILDEDANSHNTRAEFAADVHASFPDCDRCQLIHRYALAGGCVDKNTSYVLHLPLIFFQPDDYTEFLFSFPHLRSLFAAQCRLDDILNIGDIQTVPCALCPIHLDLQLRHASSAINVGAADAAYVGNCIQDFLGLFLKDFPIRSKHFDNDLSINLGNALQNVVANGLREGRLY